MFGHFACLEGDITSLTMRRHGRRSTRLRAFDYRQPGLYFVTVCTFGRKPLFGEVVEGQMRLSAFGRFAHEAWTRTPDIRAGVALDAFVVMPDHVHLLFGIVRDDASLVDASEEPIVGATRRVAPTKRERRGRSPSIAPAERERKAGPPVGSVGAIIGQYKPSVTRRIRQLDPSVRVWQRGYYDRIVRNEREADAIRQYIAENPAQWHHRTDAAGGHRI